MDTYNTLNTLLAESRKLLKLPYCYADFCIEFNLQEYLNLPENLEYSEMFKSIDFTNFEWSYVYRALNLYTKDGNLTNENILERICRAYLKAIKRKNYSRSYGRSELDMICRPNLGVDTTFSILDTVDTTFSILDKNYGMDLIRRLSKVGYLTNMRGVVLDDY